MPTFEERIAQILPRGKPRKDALTPTELEQIQSILAEYKSSSWAARPRIYALLRICGCLDLLEEFISSGLGDSDLPFAEESLPAEVQGDKSARDGILRRQSLVVPVLGALEEQNQLLQAEDSKPRALETEAENQADASSSVVGVVAHARQSTDEASSSISVEDSIPENFWEHPLIPSIGFFGGEDDFSSSNVNELPSANFAHVSRASDPHDKLPPPTRKPPSVPLEVAPDRAFDSVGKGPPKLDVPISTQASSVYSDFEGASVDNSSTADLLPSRFKSKHGDTYKFFRQPTQSEKIPTDRWQSPTSNASEKIVVKQTPNSSWKLPVEPDRHSNAPEVAGGDFSEVRIADQDKFAIVDTNRMSSIASLPSDINHGPASLFPRKSRFGSKNKLAEALKRGDMNTAELVISMFIQGAAHDTPDSARDGWTYLHFAAISENAKLTRMLLSRRALLNLDARTKTQSRTALALAAQCSNAETVSLLCDAGASVLLPSDSDGAQPLHRAVFGGNPEIVALLIKSGAGVNDVDTEGMTPLHYAVHQSIHTKSTAVARVLVENGADLETRTTTSLQTPLLRAVGNGDGLMAAFLVQCGANVNADAKLGMRAVHRAAMIGSLPALSAVVELGGANIEVRNENGWTPLHCAARYGRTNCFNYLVQRGANTYALNNKNQTPARVAMNFKMM